MAAQGIGIIFHGIGTPARALEPGEAPYWISVEMFEDILDRVAASPLRDRIRLSFDDGNASDHEIALPRLVARGLTADFFVLSGRIDAPGSLSAAQIRALDAAGMGVGSHGVAHRDWRRIPQAEMEAEVTESRAAIAAVLGRPLTGAVTGAVTGAGIPFGSYDGRVLAALRRAGYTAAWSSDRGRMDPAAFLRPRTSVQAGMGEAEVAALLTGRLPLRRWLRRAVAMWSRARG
jgi:peptidoglycan/xylan/chitin deacetylase (PgdA/CDA1 family)